jgi:predicted transcriptional regulator
MRTTISLNHIMREYPDMTAELVANQANVFVSTIRKCVEGKPIEAESERRINEVIHAYHNHHSDPHLRP